MSLTMAKLSTSNIVRYRSLIGSTYALHRYISTSCCLSSARTGRGSTNTRGKIYKEQFQPPPEFTTSKDQPRKIKWTESVLPKDLAEMRFKFPEFLPIDDIEKRNSLAQKLERIDMLRRRERIEIPEFYVGSIMAVTISDPFAPGKVSRFLGICIDRGGNGLKANFTLRNYIDNEGVEIRYEMYNPTIRTIEVIRLEKRIDDTLFYLRDAEPEFSTFPFDMESETLASGAPVPVNPLRVKMKPWPWSKNWHKIFPLVRGFEKLENVPDKAYYRSRNAHFQFEEFDLMLDYRTHVTEEDQVPIWKEVKQHEDKFSEIRKLEKRRRLLQKASDERKSK